MEEKLLTEKELCRWLNISRSTALRWRKEGMPFIKHSKSVRFNKAKILEWLERKSQRKCSEETTSPPRDMVSSHTNQLHRRLAYI